MQRLVAPHPYALKGCLLCTSVTSYIRAFYFSGVKGASSGHELVKLLVPESECLLADDGEFPQPSGWVTTRRDL